VSKLVVTEAPHRVWNAWVNRYLPIPEMLGRVGTSKDKNMVQREKCLPSLFLINLYAL
jgi:hypothetical protein